MTPREIVRAALRFQNPPRIPFILPEPWPRDAHKVGREAARNRQTQPWTRQGDIWTMIDEWGNRWQRLEHITKGEVAHGVLEDDWALLHNYEWPDVDDPEIWRDAERRCAELHAQGFYVIGGVNWPFNTTRYMRRMEIYLADLLLEPENIRRLLDGATALAIKEIEHCGAMGCDGVMGGEDWGTQDRLLISPALWRQVFKPVFRRLCDAAHAFDMDVLLHSCGHVTEVIDAWREVGLNCCQFDQPELHGIDYLAERYGGTLTFWSPVDIQRTLQTRDIPTIERAARTYVEKLGARGGGFIAGCYPADEAIGLDPKDQEAAYRAFCRFGDPHNLLGLSEDLRRVGTE